MSQVIRTPLPLNKISWRAYFELCKPRVVALILLTALVGMTMATHQGVPFPILFFGMVGIGFGASAGAAFNHLAEVHIDAVMYRTQNRPLPKGNLKLKNAFMFATLLTLLSMIILSVFVNTLTAILTFLSMIGYAAIYTLFLKPRTAQNIVIGGLAGAMPPLLGWTAVTGRFDPQSLLLVLIIFVWTPPHFWALAVYRVKEYATAKVPMLPVAYGVPYTTLNIFLYTCLLFCVSLFPFAIGMNGFIYLSSAIILGAIFIQKAWQLKKTSSPIIAMRTFRYSIVYLTILFAILPVDHYLSFYINNL